MASGTNRVILTDSDQLAIGGFWVYGGECPDVDEVIIVNSALGTGEHPARVWRILPGKPFLIFASKLES